MARSISLIILIFALSACATNAIRIDRAATMTSSGREATDATRTLMRNVQSENRESLIDLVASDPNCRLPKPIIAQGVTSPNITLCRPSDTATGTDFEIARLTRRDFGPSLAVIDGLTSYFDAVDAVVTRDPIDIAGTVSEAVATLEGIKNDLAAIAGKDGDKSPALTEAQSAAIGGTLDLLSEIISEANQVSDLRKIEFKRDQKAFATSIDQLESANVKWVNGLEGQIDNRKTLVTRRLPRIPAKQYDERRRYADQLLTLIERQEQLPQLQAALAQTVRALKETHASYRALLFGDKRQFTLAEKRKAAAITRSRLRGVLSNLANIIRAF
jgi:hypothetical protein